MQKKAIIMAGGIGDQLWPESREHYPKQFLHVLDSQTLLENTYSRLRNFFSRENMFVVTHDSFREKVHRSLPLLKNEQIISEPKSRNTAPCMALSTMIVNKIHRHQVQESYAIAGENEELDTEQEDSAEEQDFVIAIFPSDHIIENSYEFQECLETALLSAEQLDGIITIGVTPTRAETSYGYIQMSPQSSIPMSLYKRGLRSVKNFAEKPDLQTAERFIKSDYFLWNSGIVVAKYSVLVKALEEFLPEMMLLFRSLEKVIDTSFYADAVDNVYRQIRSTSIDRGILEKAVGMVYVIESTFSWSDVGSWDEMYRISDKDEQGNVVDGNVTLIDCKTSYVKSSSRFVSIVGMENVIVIDNPDSLFICKRGSSGRVKEIVDALRRKQLQKVL